MERRTEGKMLPRNAKTLRAHEATKTTASATTLADCTHQHASAPFNKSAKERGEQKTRGRGKVEGRGRRRRSREERERKRRWRTNWLAQYDGARQPSFYTTPDVCLFTREGKKRDCFFSLLDLVDAASSTFMAREKNTTQRMFVWRNNIAATPAYYITRNTKKERK